MDALVKVTSDAQASNKVTGTPTFFINDEPVPDTITWEKVEQETVFGQLEPIPDPRERLRALFTLVAHEFKSHVIYSELLKALDHPAVQPVIGRVSERRLDYLTASFRQAGLSRTDAQHRARLLYAAYVGFLQLNLQLHQARMQHDEFEAYVEHMMATLIPST